MKEFSAEELKVFRRLRQAFRRAVLVCSNCGATPEEAKKAIARICARAVKIGWLELPKKA